MGGPQDGGFLELREGVQEIQVSLASEFLPAWYINTSTAANLTVESFIVPVMHSTDGQRHFLVWPVR
jgi:hypothetical protein